MTTALEKAKAIKDRLDTTTTDPKWLNEEIDALLAQLQMGDTGATPVEVALTLTESMMQAQVDAANKMVLAINRATAAQLNIEKSRQNAPLRKMPAPRDIAYIALMLFNGRQKTALEQEKEFNATEAANKSWDNAQIFREVSAARENQWYALLAERQAAAQAAAKAAAEAETDNAAGS